MSTFSSDPNRQSGQFNTFGHRKAPIQIGASGVNNSLQPKLSSPRYSLSHTFTGITPGVSVILIDRLFSIEANDVWRSQIVRTGTVNEFGQIGFSRLRDSIYSLLVVDLAHTDESLHDISIGDPQRFDTIAKHSIPSQPYIFNTEYADTGTTAQATIFWRIGADGIDGYPEVYYTASGAGQWTLFNRFEDTNVYSATVQPLAYDTDFQFKVRLINEDLLSGHWSNIVSVTSSDLAVSGSENASTKLVLHMDFEDKADLFKDTSGRGNTPTGGNPLDYTANSLYGEFSYYCDSGVNTLTLDSPDIYLSNSHPRTSLMLEGTYEILSGLSHSSSFGLLGSTGGPGLSVMVDASTDFIDSARFIYGNATLVDIAIPTVGKAVWPLGKAKHISAVFDGSDSTNFVARLFIDGILIGSGSMAHSTLNEYAPLTILGSSTISGFYGAADEVKLWRIEGSTSPDDSDSHIKATIPAPGVFNTGFDYPRAEINANTYSGGSNPKMSFHDINGGLYFSLTASGLLFDPDNAVEGYALVADADGNAGWAQVSGIGASGIYNTVLATGLQMPEAVGGIDAGTTVGDLLGNSFTALFDDLLFPTVLASIQTQHSVKLTGVSTQTVEVGLSMSPFLTGTFIPGVIENGDGSTGPNLVKDSTSMVFRNPNDSSMLPPVTPVANVAIKFAPAYAITFGSNTWDVLADFPAGAGPYYNNKGVSGTNLDAYRVSGIDHDESNVVTGRYYYWYGYGAQSSAPTNSAGVRALTDKSFLNSSNGGTWDITIPAGTPEVYFYTISGKVAEILYVESSYADVTGTFTKTGISVNDAAAAATDYESYVSYIGAAGYPSEATYRVTMA
jgi:hypothetical protein